MLLLKASTHNLKTAPNRYDGWILIFDMFSAPACIKEALTEGY